MPTYINSRGDVLDVPDALEAFVAVRGFVLAEASVPPQIPAVSPTPSTPEEDDETPEGVTTND